MKTKSGILTVLVSMMMSLFSFTNTKASSMHNETVTFKVYGNCTMCKKRIETALTKTSGITSAVWDVNTKMVTVVYDPHTITVDAIHKPIADVGHDTDKLKAPDDVYSKLPGCCQYERKK